MERRANREPIPRDDASSQTAPPSDATGAAGSSPGYQFDWLNWFYWSVWWQQYSYWAWLHHSQQQASPPIHPTGDGVSPQQPTQGGPQLPQVGVNGVNQHDQVNQFNQFNPYYQFNPAMAPRYGGWGHQHGNVPGAQTGMLLRIRLINGYETSIAPVWKRFVAELIDTFLFILLLKAYFPDSDFRIPEILLEGKDVWRELKDEELDAIHEVIITFLFSVFFQKIHHAIAECIWLAVFSCTPGKWVMGLRVVRCHSVHLTRTQPGLTIRVDPGGKLPIWLALVRSLFKALFSLLCPLIIFFFSLKRGQTKYDELFGSAVVDYRAMFRPVYSGRGFGAARVAQAAR